MINKISLDNIASFSNFDFDTKSNKNIVIFGTNGSGKSTFVDILQVLNKYCKEPTVDNLNKLKDYVKSKVSKETDKIEVTVAIKFNNTEQIISYNKDTNELIIDAEKWKNVKVFNDKYTSATIGNSIDINLKENGLTIGESNNDLEKERIKQKKLITQRNELNKKILSTVETSKIEYTALTGSKSVNNLSKFSKENLLLDTCIYSKDDTLLPKRDKLGRKTIKQQSTIIDIEVLKSFFNTDYWEELFNEEILKPELSDNYKDLLIKYSDFYKSGMNITESEEKQCPFCLQEWDSKKSVFDDFQKYLTSDYNEKKEKINSFNEELIKFKSLIENKNKEINMQEKIVQYECEQFDIDFSNYKIVKFEEDSIIKLQKSVEKKLQNMTTFYSIKKELTAFVETYYNLFKVATLPLNEIRTSINNRATTVQKLNTKIAEHNMKVLWEAKEKLRTDYNKIEMLIKQCDEKISELESKNEDINTIQGVFNGLLKFIGLEEYFLDMDNKLQLKIDSSYDITNEGNRISTAQRKILSLCYFYAEIISEITNVSDLKNYTIIYDDPVDSADYIFFHSITSLIENIEKILIKVLQKPSISIGQNIVFTHNSLLFNRLTQNFSLKRKISKVNQNTKIQEADKIENNYKIYIEVITEFYKRGTSNQREKIFIGNIIRRVLEIVVSFNKLNSNNVSIISDYGKPTLGLIANHLSHENFSKVLNPLPTDDEMKKACKELFEIIKEYHPKQFEYIEEKYLKE